MQAPPDNFGDLVAAAASGQVPPERRRPVNRGLMTTPAAEVLITESRDGGSGIKDHASGAGCVHASRGRAAAGTTPAPARLVDLDRGAPAGLRAPVCRLERRVTPDQRPAGLDKEGQGQ